MIEYKNINANESGLSVRAKINGMFSSLINGGEGVNNLWKSLVRVTESIKALELNMDNSYAELREQVLQSYAHTDSVADDLRLYINSMNGGVSGFAIDTSFEPNFPEDKAATVLAAGSGTFIHFLDVDGNPITIADDDALTIFYKGENSSYWRYKSVYARVGITKLGVTLNEGSATITADNVSADIQGATTSRAGLLSATDKRKLDESAKNITEEITNRQTEVTAIKRGTVQSGSLHLTGSTDEVSLEYRNFETTEIHKVPFAAATKNRAGIMTALDKERLDSAYEATKNFTDVPSIEKGTDIAFVLCIKSDGTFVKASPVVLRSAHTQYLTEGEYQNLVDSGLFNNDMEYNVCENG